jgi:hypothetical protein
MPGAITGNRRSALLQVDGLRETMTRLDAMGERARRPEPALRARGTQTDLEQSEKRRFDKQKGWAKLSKRWVREKRRRGLKSGTLRATGRLERALTNTVKSLGVRLNVFNSVLEFGVRRGRSDIYYAQPLATGTSRMKPRQMVVIDEIAQIGISERVRLYIVDNALEG